MFPIFFPPLNSLSKIEKYFSLVKISTIAYTLGVMAGGSHSSGSFVK